MSQKISSRQLFFLVFLARSTTVVSSLSLVTSYQVMHDVWLSGILVCLTGPAITWTIMSLVIRFPNETFIQYAPRVFGPIIGKVVSVIFILVLIHQGSLVLRVFGETLTIPFFPGTPLVVIISMMAVLVILAVRYGIEVIGRLSELFIIPFILGVIVIVGASMQIWDVQWMLPILTQGIQPILLGATTSTAIFVEGILILMIAPHVGDLKRARPTATWASFWAAILNLIVATTILLSFGPYEMHRIPLPLYYLARVITLGAFYERIEAVPLFSWSLALLINLALFMYAVVTAITQLFGQKRYVPLTLPMGVIFICLSFMAFSDFTQFRMLQLPNIAGVYGLGLVFPIVPITLLVAALRKIKPAEARHTEDV